MERERSDFNYLALFCYDVTGIPIFFLVNGLNATFLKSDTEVTLDAIFLGASSAFWLKMSSSFWSMYSIA